MKEVLEHGGVHLCIFHLVFLNKNIKRLLLPLYMCTSSTFLCLSCNVECLEDANEEEIARVVSEDKILIMNEPVHEHICGACLVTNTNVAHNHTINS